MIVNAFVDYCFSPKSQVLYRNDLLKDIKVKATALNILSEELGVPLDIEKIIADYKRAKEQKLR